MRPDDNLETWVCGYRRIALALVLATAFAEGLIVSQSAPARFLVAIAFASSITLWCGLDARLHGKLFLRSFAWLMMFTWPIGAAVHLVWTRGPRGVLTYLEMSLACMAATGVGLALAALLRTN